jgi:hypothetical protein
MIEPEDLRSRLFGLGWEPGEDIGLVLHGHTDNREGYVGFTPEVRDRYIAELDRLVTWLRHARTHIAALDWRECEQCAARFVAGPSARYCSGACRQRAYRERHRNGG